MPQVKGLKELKLPVGNDERKGRYDGSTLTMRGRTAISAVFYFFTGMFFFPKYI
jgi:hypothetical protein